MIFFAKNRFRSKTVSYELSDNSVLGDYHFWYQTYDGTWANKHGDEEPVHLGNDTLYTNNSSGWALSFEGMAPGVYNNFYDSDIYVYVISLS